MGPLFTARSAIASCMMATQTVGKTYYDQHPEEKWYNYTEESEEPAPPKERMFGIKVMPRAPLQLDSDMLDLDTDIILKGFNSKLRNNKSSSYGKASFRGRAPSNKSSEKGQFSRMSSANKGDTKIEIVDFADKIATSLVN